MSERLNAFARGEIDPDALISLPFMEDIPRDTPIAGLFFSGRPSDEENVKGYVVLDAYLKEKACPPGEERAAVRKIVETPDGIDVQELSPLSPWALSLWYTDSGERGSLIVARNAAEDKPLIFCSSVEHIVKKESPRLSIHDLVRPTRFGGQPAVSDIPHTPRQDIFPIVCDAVFMVGS